MRRTVTLIDTAAGRAGAGGVARVNQGDRDTRQLCLVFDKASELIERPGVVLPPLAPAYPYHKCYNINRYLIGGTLWVKLQKQGKNPIADGEKRTEINCGSRINFTEKHIKTKLESKSSNGKDILNLKRRNIIVGIGLNIQRNSGDILSPAVSNIVKKYWSYLVGSVFSVGLMIGELYKLTISTAEGIRKERLTNHQPVITKSLKNQSERARRNIKSCVLIATKLNFIKGDSVRLQESLMLVRRGYQLYLRNQLHSINIAQSSTLDKGGGLAHSSAA